MKILTRIVLTAGLALSLSTAANATPTLSAGSTTTDPLGVDNLVVDGTIYDVRFSLSTLNSFTQGSTLSNDANSALTSALNALKVTELADINPSEAYWIDIDNSLVPLWDGPTRINISGDGWVADTYVGPGTASLGLSSDESIYVEAADFRRVGTVGVPEPLTLGLFGTGLAALFMLRRRDKKAAQAILVR